MFTWNTENKDEIMKKQFKTSVIIPVYNTKEYLEECIDSVLKQTQKEIEIILVDDGSTDGSTELIRQYVNNYSFIRAVYQENQKLGAARNVGANIAEGEYLYFLDSDDYIDENLLEVCYQVASKQRLDFVMFDANSFTEDGCEDNGGQIRSYDRSLLPIEDKVYTGLEFWEKFYGMQGVFQNAYLLYINRAFYQENKLAFEPNIFYEDNDWIVDMYQKAKKIMYIPQKLYFRRYRTGSIMMEKYTNVHLQSCIFLSRKLVGMVITTEDETVCNMYEQVAYSVLSRLVNIIKSYCQEEKKDVLAKELSDLMVRWLSDVEKITEKSERIEGIISGVADFLLKKNVFAENEELSNGWRKQIGKDLRVCSLEESNSVVGIYGKGMVGQKFLRIYNEYVGEIKAHLFFIDTYSEVVEWYEGYKVYNVNHLPNVDRMNIIIASKKYKDEMLQNIQRLGKMDIEIQCVPEIVYYIMR